MTKTHISCLTAPGKAALATLAVRGPLAWQIVHAHFTPRKGGLPNHPSVGQYWYGKLGEAEADDVILAVKQGPPAISLEVHCHGGLEVVRMIREVFVNHGAIDVPWQNFHRESSEFSNLLALALTTRTVAILLDQAHGAWEAMLREVQNADHERQGQIVRRLAELIPLGQHLVEPWQVVIAGAPNVGKSSLMNALAGFARSVVSPLAGTTRDAVTLTLAIDGWPIDVTDTAGIRESSSDLERQGIARAQAVFARADMRLWLLDGSMEPIFPEDPTGWLFLINKIDLPAGWNWHEVPQALRISAHTQSGLAELCERISRELAPQPPVPGEAVPVTAAQANWIQSRELSNRGSGIDQ